MNKYYLNIPYPNYEHITYDNEYAYTILSHINGLHSKMSAISLYFYNSIILQKDYIKIKETMESVCTTELYHLKILSDIAFILKADPRLWTFHDDSLEYWSPSYNIYSSDIKNILENAIDNEQHFIDFYKQQLKIVDNPIICKVYKRLLLDDELHLKLFKELLEDQS